MAAMKDNIFADGDFNSGSFRFNEDVAYVFDDMANRSIPYYKEVIQLTAEIANSLVPENGQVYDIGCSTGNTLIFLAKTLKDKPIKLTGYDPSEAMVSKALEKASVFTYSHDISFEVNSCQKCSLKNADMIILNYTLQFIDVEERNEVIQKLYDSLNPGGVLIMSEKLRQEDKKIEDFNTSTYENFKSGNGYSFLEIANKRQALENILVPDSLSGNLSLLNRNGFKNVEILFKWLNFTTFAAFK
jgi:tRNA (cmo5U34)-methyltransferase